jgi:butyryl-CoA dehydrogenase
MFMDGAAPAPARRAIEQDFPRLAGRRRAAQELGELRAWARRFADNEIAPRALELDARAELDPATVDQEIVRRGAIYGLLNLMVPRPAGGRGALAVDTAIVMEELCAACPGIALIFGAHALGMAPLLAVGGIAHWDGVLRDTVKAAQRGEPELMAFAITEPDAGTDVEDPDLLRRGRVASAAREVSGGYRLNGVKRFISNGSVARWITTFMPLDRSRPAETMTCFLVDTRTPGFSVSGAEHKLGQRACPAAELVYEDVFVPADMVVGRPGDGMAATMIVLATSRSPVGAIATGIAAGAYRRLLTWLQEDPKGTKLLAEQHVQLELARMEEEIHLARQAYLDAATELDVVALGGALRHPAVRLAGALPHAVRARGPLRRAFTSPRARDATAALLRRTTDDARMTRALALASLAKAHSRRFDRDPSF